MNLLIDAHLDDKRFDLLDDLGRLGFWQLNVKPAGEVNKGRRDHEEDEEEEYDVYQRCELEAVVFLRFFTKLHGLALFLGNLFCSVGKLLEELQADLFHLKDVLVDPAPEDVVESQGGDSDDEPRGRGD